MSIIEEEAVPDAQSFIALLRRSNSRWQGSDESETGWSFRGQGDATWDLLPSAFRPPKVESLLHAYREHLRKRTRSTDWTKWIGRRVIPLAASSVLADAAVDALAHATLVREFILLADDVRHRVVVESMLWHLFAETREDFGSYFVGQVPREVAQLFAVAQHHGVPTQFLDWTSNPLVAAYFAAERAATFTTAGHLAVWAIRNKVFDTQWSLERFTVPAGVTPFLDAQAGLFTWHPTAYIRRVTDGAYVPFDKLVEELDGDPHFAHLPRPFLYKITLAYTEVASVMKLLWRERVTPAHLMPTFDNITRALEVRSQWLDR